MLGQGHKGRASSHPRHLERRAAGAEGVPVPRPLPPSSLNSGCPQGNPSPFPRSGHLHPLSLPQGPQVLWDLGASAVLAQTDLLSLVPDAPLPGWGVPGCGQEARGRLLTPHASQRASFPPPPGPQGLHLSTGDGDPTRPAGVAVQPAGLTGG